MSEAEPKSYEPWSAACLKSELEKAKSDRNAEGMRVRAELLPKLEAMKRENTRLEVALAHAQNRIEALKLDRAIALADLDHFKAQAGEQRTLKLKSQEEVVSLHSALEKCVAALEKTHIIAEDIVKLDEPFRKMWLKSLHDAISTAKPLLTPT